MSLYYSRTSTCLGTVFVMDKINIGSDCSNKRNKKTDFSELVLLISNNYILTITTVFYY